MRLLLLSNSTNKGEQFLGYPQPEIVRFLGSNIKSILFVPFAGVTITFDYYFELVEARFREMGYSATSLHRMSDPAAAIANAEAIVTGGGNTFHLLTHLYRYNAIEAIRSRVIGGAPFIGWSAGSNIACPTIRTTNDMPIIQPPSFDALNLVPFQLNPHYSDFVPEGHRGETRDDRLKEFTKVNPDVNVVGLREGTMLERDGSALRLIGNETAKVFHGSDATRELTSSESLEWLL